MALNVLDFIKVYDETSALLAKKSNKIVVLKVDTIPLPYRIKILHSNRTLFKVPYLTDDILSCTRGGHYDYA